MFRVREFTCRGLLPRPTGAPSSSHSFWEDDMKETEPDLNRSMEESPPDFSIQIEAIPPVFSNQQGEVPEENSGAGEELNSKRLHRRGIWKMKCIGCPLAKLCGMELAQDAYIEVTRPDRERARSIEALAHKFIDRRSINKKRDCRCSSTVEIIEAGDVSENAQDEVGSTPVIPLNQYPSPSRDPAQTYEHILRLKGAYLQLGPEDKQLFDLVLRAGLESKEAALILGIEAEAVRQRVS